MIHYTIGFEQANAHIFDIKLNINFPLHKGQQFYLPDWIPGSYMIRDFARNIITLDANTKGTSVGFEKTGKSGWQLLENVDCLEINYQVYAWDLSVRSAHLDNVHGFFNGTSLFLAIKNYESEKHTVILNASLLAKDNNWIVATAMPAKNIDSNGFGKYVSDNYQELIDHPFEFGQLVKVSFDVFGVPHDMFFTEAPPRVDWERIAADLKKICETEVKFFGDEKPPFERYVFMTFVQKKGFGGLEHMASTALHCSFEDLPLISENSDKVDENYRTFLSLCCHEYFHNWNVKRIKPASFIPMSLNKEVHTELLWFFEGITSYYDELLLARSGVIPVDAYLDMIAKLYTRVMRGKGRYKQTVTESSFDAWTKFYKQDENAMNAIVSYYTKGAMVAFCLDQEIRHKTNGMQSLDDLMRVIWRDYGKTGRGLGETQVQQLVKELTGQSFNEFFDKALYSTDDLPLKEYFDRLGVNYQQIPQYLATEKGGYIDKPKERQPLSFLGVICQADPLGAKVSIVFEDSCAQMAGISSGDIIIAIDDIRITADELDKTISRIPLSTQVSISYFRRDKLYRTECTLTHSDDNTVYLSFQNEKPADEIVKWVLG
ncbi:M61 family metallopeptidase [Aliikangiella sp. G2MR2-5]|uniref:M61 family metallopeptidase n=1 Tax=Aliikangiella sp. G2MR2-5 TaxID=2788943 RepID=UPI0018A9BF63|nr:PDZ domain-containing protein [Aliikangiella sp. G2MR2-5]